MKQKEQPISAVKWIDRDKLKPNNYNPNKVAPTEMELLKISILENGWTQPIVINKNMEIVDGFHRWTVSGTDEIKAFSGGQVPTVMLSHTDQETQKMATIRHNRARGTHGVLEMSNIVVSLVEGGLTGEEIMERLKMEREEVSRLLFKAGIPKSDVFENMEFSNAWIPEGKE